MYYSALFLVEALVGKDHHETLYEEKLVLIEALDEGEAQKKAKALFDDGSLTYHNVYGEEVQWTPVKIVGICEIMDSSLRNGTELHSRYFRDLSDYEKVEPRARKKAN